MMLFTAILILVKVYLFGKLSNPAREAGCGVLVFNLPGKFTGIQVLIFLLVLGIALMFGGGRLWWVSTYPKVGIKVEESWGVVSLIVVILTGLVTSYLGIFGISVGLFYLAVLMIGVMVPHFIFSRWKV